MIARCLFTSLAEIADPRLREHVGRFVHLGEIGLVRGDVYNVEGVVFRSGVCWFYICDEPNATYPKPYCSAFFELEDPSIPPSWQIVIASETLLLPTAWATTENFYERLVDGDVTVQRIFNHLRASK